MRLESSHTQAPDWFPMAHTLSAFYAQRPQLCNVAFDTLLSTLCTLLIFIGLPAMDLILGMDPKDPTQARNPSPPSQSGHQECWRALWKL